MNILIIGLPSCGKTTIGKRLANLLSREFIDIDQRIIEKYGKANSCRQICLEKGEDFFRALEKQQIKELIFAKNSVISLGGGSLCDPDNRQLITKLGLLLYLKASPQVLWKRLLERGIPSFLDQKNPEEAFTLLAKEREPLYASVAQLTIETNALTEQNIVAMIIEQAEQDRLSKGK